jgi:CO dehydrogenase/acetyl-CoA synthase beta subunit
MFALGFIAFAFDKLNSTRKEKLFADRTGTSAKVGEAEDGATFQPPIPFKAKDVYEHLIPEEQGISWSTEQDKKKSAEMKNFLQKQFGTTSVRNIEHAELKAVLEGEPLMKRAMYRKMNAIN